MILLIMNPLVIRVFVYLFYYNAIIPILPKAKSSHLRFHELLPLSPIALHLSALPDTHPGG